MAIEIFNRTEKKYLLSTDDYINLRSCLSEHMKLDEYNVSGACYTISNIYFDTPDNTLIRNSLLKPKYKEKLRLRGYGVPEKDDMVYLEIKKKFKSVVNKRRTALHLDEAYDFVRTKKMPTIKSYMNPQILKELEYFIKDKDIEPKLYLAYDRIAYFDKQNRDLRVSFDTNIRTRRFDLRLEKGDYGKLLLPEGNWVMEIKTEGSIPLWLTQLLSKYKIYCTSFSKYGNEYLNFVADSIKGDEEQCLTQYSAILQKQRYQLAQQS